MTSSELAVGVVAHDEQVSFNCSRTTLRMLNAAKSKSKTTNKLGEGKVARTGNQKRKTENGESKSKANQGVN